LIDELLEEHSPNLIVEWQNMENKESLDLFFAYNLSGIPVVVFNYDPSTAFYDLELRAQSSENLEDKVEYFIEKSLDYDDSLSRQNFTSMSQRPDITYPIVIASGLIDGINPCAFSLLIFFLSYLTTIKKNRLNIITTGLMYILGVFIGYLSIGLGLIHTVSILGIYQPFGKLGIIVMIVIGLIQIYEATSFGARLLHFPGFAIPMFKNLVEKANLIVALVLGCFVSLFEFPCSGGVYLGILVLLASKASFVKGFSLLVLYNIMFIVPLLVLLFLGTSTDILLKMDEWRVISRQRIKLVSGIFIIILSIIMWVWLFKN
jgi:cytochrome c biogenesis protein CcdA